MLLIDEYDRVLLFRGDDPAIPAGPQWWFSAGGGLQDGETAEAAARREVLEETGIAVESVVGPLWTRDSEYGFLGKLYVQHEVFFMARVSAVSVDCSGFEAHETDSIHEHRWWSVADLRATQETYYPPALPDLLEVLLRDGPPSDLAVIL